MDPMRIPLASVSLLAPTVFTQMITPTSAEAPASTALSGTIPAITALANARPATLEMSLETAAPSTTLTCASRPAQILPSTATQ